MKRISIGSLIRRRWTVIVTVIVVAVTGFSVYRLHGIFGSNNVVSRPSADSLGNSTYNPKRVLFEVFGTPGSVATISYLDEDAQPQRAGTGVRGPARCACAARALIVEASRHGSHLADRRGSRSICRRSAPGCSLVWPSELAVALLARRRDS